MNVYLLQVVNGVGIGMLYFLLAVGLSIIFGLLRFVNFAHGAFYALGAYLCFQALQMGMDFWLALVLAPIVIGALAWVTEKVLLRHVYAQAHEFHILVTVGLALVVQELIIVAWGPLGVDVPAPDALQGVVMWGDFVYPKYRLFVIGFTAVLALALSVIADGLLDAALLLIAASCRTVAAGALFFGVFPLQRRTAADDYCRRCQESLRDHRNASSA